MQRRLIGNTKEEVSLLGFGCMRLPTLPNGEIDEAEAIAMIRYAVDHGVNYLDTAYGYHGGQSEPFVGRYLAETLRMCSPERYEIYETAARWAHWLVQKYGVVLRPTNGSTLAHTPSGSVDLAHAHKTFPALSFLSTCRYLAEMARVVRVGGKVVFDVVTEDCMDARTLRDWLATGSGYGEYPNVMPRSEIEDLFARLKLRCEGEFLESMKPGVTHYFVTVKYASQD